MIYNRTFELDGNILTIRNPDEKWEINLDMESQTSFLESLEKVIDELSFETIEALFTYMISTRGIEYFTSVLEAEFFKNITHCSFSIRNFLRTNTIPYEILMESYKILLRNSCYDSQCRYIIFDTFDKHNIELFILWRDLYYVRHENDYNDLYLFLNSIEDYNFLESIEYLNIEMTYNLGTNLMEVKTEDDIFVVNQILSKYMNKSEYKLYNALRYVISISNEEAIQYWKNAIIKNNCKEKYNSLNSFHCNYDKVITDRILSCYYEINPEMFVTHNNSIFNLYISSDSQYISRYIDIINWFDEHNLPVIFKNNVFDMASLYHYIDLLDFLYDRCIRMNLKINYSEKSLDLDETHNTGYKLKYSKTDVFRWWLQKGLPLKYNENLTAICYDIELLEEINTTSIQGLIEFKYSETFLIKFFECLSDEVKEFWCRKSTELNFGEELKKLLDGYKNDLDFEHANKALLSSKKSLNIPNLISARSS